LSCYRAPQLCSPFVAGLPNFWLREPDIQTLSPLPVWRVDRKKILIRSPPLSSRNRTHRARALSRRSPSDFLNLVDRRGVVGGSVVSGFGSPLPLEVGITTPSGGVLHRHRRIMLSPLFLFNVSFRLSGPDLEVLVSRSLSGMKALGVSVLVSFQPDKTCLNITPPTHMHPIQYGSKSA